MGFAPAGMSHSSGARTLANATRSAGTTITLACCRSVAAIRVAMPFSCSMLATRMPARRAGLERLRECRRRAAPDCAAPGQRYCGARVGRGSCSSAARSGIQHAEHVCGITQIAMTIVGGQYSSIQARAQLHKTAAYPAFHGSERHLAVNRQLVIRGAAEKASRTALHCCGSSVSRQSRRRCRSWLACAAPAGEGCSSAVFVCPSASSNRSSRCWRRRSIALLRDSAISQVIAPAFATSKLAERRQMVV